MILIVSVSQDPTTDEVIKWLIHYKAEFIRVNEGDFIESTSIKITNEGIRTQLKWADKHFFLSDLSAMWYRRGAVKLLRNEYHNLPTKISEVVNNVTDREAKVVEEFIAHRLSGLKTLGNLWQPSLNKLMVLEKACEVGLCIPDTEVVDNFSFDYSQDGSYINKTLAEVVNFKVSDNFYYSRTQRVSEVELGASQKVSLAQKEIIKDFEIRTFYLHGKFYSVAIFSQQNKETELDFRNRNHQLPVVPYNLPSQIEEKLDRLMKLMGLNSGVIDLLKSKMGEYIFLEINPQGQFGFISKWCNYNLEHEIAKFLVHD